MSAAPRRLTASSPRSGIFSATRSFVEVPAVRLGDFDHHCPKGALCVDFDTAAGPRPDPLVLGWILFGRLFYGVTRAALRSAAEVSVVRYLDRVLVRKQR